MSAKFLLGCFEVPGWGGANTFLYTLFAQMRRAGFDVGYLNLVRDLDEVALQRAFGSDFGNPLGLDGVHTLTLEENPWRQHRTVTDLVRDLRPDLMVACGFIGAWVMKTAAPHVPIAFITSGLRQMKRLMQERLAKDFVDFRRQVARGAVFEAPAKDREREAVVASDLIVLHSPHVRFGFEHFFSSHMGKVYDNLISIADVVYAEAEPFNGLARPFDERDIDAIFIASNWRRHEKNADLLARIARAADGMRIHVVGDSDRDHVGVEHHGLVARREDVFGLMGRSKAIVCPSRWDPAPGVLFEASAMGCNVIASENCGNWNLCHPRLLAEPDSEDSFLSAMQLARSAPFPDNRHLFRGGYADLVETLSAFA